MTTLHDFTATDIDGNEVDLSDLQGKVALVVNTASKCGFTPQYEGLEELHRTYGDKGLVVLGFPCDQFAHQEPGDEEEIKSFCSLTYDVTFPMFSKVDVNGDDAHPLFRWLREQKGGVLGDRVKWNFTKVLIGKDGTPIKRYAPTDTPEKIEKDLAKVLG